MPVVLNIWSQLALLPPWTLAELRPSLFWTIILETTDTARAYGINPSSSIGQHICARVNELPSDVGASTALDLEKGLPLEVDWISGSVARLAKEKGLEAPTNETIHGLLFRYKDGL